ncbi:unnamed protein product, partial [Soboliphyme baturini]|uniref:Succinyl-CoA:3-ketoacid-coenzyme A transferase n=1 Tax=Soboliphyme baturini TaxID=241478 RepID=A0A183IBJ0_9BILA
IVAVLRRRCSTACIHKLFNSADDAVNDVVSGAKILTGGFGLCGMPQTLFKALAAKNVKDLTIIGTSCGLNNYGPERLIKNNQVKRVVTTYVVGNQEVIRRYFAGSLELEMIPTGTLAERIRAAGAGVPAFYCPVGSSTLVEEGGWPVKYNDKGEVTEITDRKEKRIFNGVPYLLEEALFGDVAFVKAWMADTDGNLVFRKTARNLNPDVCKAAKLCIVEAEKIVQAGELDPNDVHVPGLFVHRIVQSQEKTPIEKVIYQNDEVSNPAAELRHRIARRAVLEFRDHMNGAFCLNSHFCNGSYPVPGEEDPDLINAAKESITVKPGAAYFSTVDSFAMIRSGKIDLAIMGAMEVSQFGDLASWFIPSQMIKGMGAAFDFASASRSVGGHTRLVVCMEHLAKGGKQKIVGNCQLPLTGRRVVDMIITEKCVFRVDPEDGLLLTEIAEGVSIEEIISATALCRCEPSPLHIGVLDITAVRDMSIVFSYL